MNRWRRLIEQEGHARHGLARAAALVSTEREAEVALVSAGYTATEVRALIGQAAREDDYARAVGRTRRTCIEGVSPRATLDGARAVLAGIDRGRALAMVHGATSTAMVESPIRQSLLLDAVDDMPRHLAPARPWLDAAIFGFRDYPRTLTGYLSASERHVGARVAASMSGAEATGARWTKSQPWAAKLTSGRAHS